MEDTSFSITKQRHLQVRFSSHQARNFPRRLSLSPLFFCMSLIPLSNELNNTEYGYTIFNSKVNHLFYMDDLKLFARNDNELEGLLATAKEFRNDIGMTFDLEKSAKVSFRRGSSQKTTDIEIDI